MAAPGNVKGLLLLFTRLPSASRMTVSPRSARSACQPLGANTTSSSAADCPARLGLCSSFGPCTVQLLLHRSWGETRVSADCEWSLGGQSRGESPPTGTTACAAQLKAAAHWPSPSGTGGASSADQGSTSPCDDLLAGEQHRRRSHRLPSLREENGLQCGRHRWSLPSAPEKATGQAQRTTGQAG